MCSSGLESRAVDLKRYVDRDVAIDEIARLLNTGWTYE